MSITRERFARASSTSLILALLLALATSAFAQVSPGTILGETINTGGKAVKDTAVTVTNDATGFVRRAMTNSTGQYRVTTLPPGTYSVFVQATGFRGEVRTTIAVHVDSMVRVDFELVPGDPADRHESSQKESRLQADDTGASQVISGLSTLPSNGRNIEDFVSLTAGTFIPESTTFHIDGIPNNATVSGGQSVRTNLEAISEFREQTSLYGAQYGRYAGPQVDAVTRGGDNILHGAAYDYIRNSRLDARNVFDEIKAGDTRGTQFGFVIGGPIVRNHAYFFVGTEGQRKRVVETTAPSVPLAEFWAGNLSRMRQVAIDPVTGLPFPGNVLPANRISPASAALRSQWSEAIVNDVARNARAVRNAPHDYMLPHARFDYLINPQHEFHGSYSYYREELTSAGRAGGTELPGFSVEGHLLSQGLQFSETWSVSPRVVNAMRTGVERVRNDLYPQDRSNPSQRIAITGFADFGDTPATRQPLRENSWYAGDAVTLQKGMHLVRFGADYLLQQLAVDAIDFGAGGMTFNGSQTGNAFADYLLGLPAVNERQVQVAPLRSYPRRTTVDVFVQDDWRAATDLSVSLGLRYDNTGRLRERFGKLAAFDPTINGGQGGIRMIGDSPRFDSGIRALRDAYPGIAIVRGSDDLHRSDGNNFAPRVGAALSLVGNMVARASYGVFFSTGDLCGCEFFTNAPFTLSQRNGAIRMAGIDPAMGMPYYQEWRVGLQHESRGYLLDFAYYGNKGTKVTRVRDINQPLDHKTNTTRPYPLFDRIPYLENSGLSNYNGVHARIEKRNAAGEWILVSYAYGKMIDTASMSPQDSYNLRAERGLSDTDVRHRLTVSFIEPIRVQKKGAAGVLLNDWKVAGIFRANTGSPQTASLSMSRSGSGNTGWDRPNLVGVANSTRPSAREWWSNFAYAAPPVGEFGSAGRNTLSGPEYVNADLSVLKDFQMRDRQRMQFRFEFFNVFNHRNYRVPESTFTDAPNFGVATATYPARQVQIGFKYLF